MDHHSSYYSAESSASLTSSPTGDGVPIESHRLLDAYYKTHLPVSNTLGISADAAFPPPLDISGPSGSTSGSGSSSRSFLPTTPSFNQGPNSAVHQGVVDSPAAYVPHLDGFAAMFDPWTASHDGSDPRGSEPSLAGCTYDGHGGSGSCATIGLDFDFDGFERKPQHSTLQPSTMHLPYHPYINQHQTYGPPLDLSTASPNFLPGPTTDSDASARHRAAALTTLFQTFPHPDSLYGLQPSPYLATPHRGRSPFERQQPSPPSDPSRPETALGGDGAAVEERSFREAWAEAARRKGEGFQLRMESFSPGTFLRRRSFGGGVMVEE